MAGVQIKQKMVQQIEMALLKLNHIPYITSRKKKMAVWSDIREALFIRCVHPKCSVVLSALKSCLRYPASKKFMHPCTPEEQLLFMKEYMVVSPCTLLVDLTALENRFDMMTLFDMIKIKHDMSDDEVIRDCNVLSEARRGEKCFQKCAENPLRNVPGKLFLPSIQRKNAKENTKLTDSFIKSVVSDTLSEEANKALVPVYLLQGMYPVCTRFLDEVVRLYVTGQYQQTILRSISQCSPEEGFQFSRFMAMQHGFEKYWPYFTSNSLLISWEEFWQHNSRNGNQSPIPVVILNCKALDECDGCKFAQPCPDKEHLQSSHGKGSNTYSEDIYQQTANTVFPCQTNTEPDLTYRNQGISCHSEKIIDEFPSHLENKDNVREEKLVSLVDTKKLKKSESYTSKSTKDRFVQGESVSKDFNPVQITLIDYETAQNYEQPDKTLRVTRSRSQSNATTNTCKSKQFMTGTEEVLSNCRNSKRTDIAFSHNYKKTNKDSNNSADLDNISNKSIPDRKTAASDVSEEKLYYGGEYDCQSIVSNESDFTEQNVFGTGKIDVSITLKKNLVDEKNDKEAQAIESNKALGSSRSRSSSPHKHVERKTLKLAVSKFTNKIPQQLRVNKYLLKSDTSSERKQLSPQTRSPVEKKKVRELVTDRDKPREGAFVTKSLELKVPETTTNLESRDKEQFPYKARRVQPVERKEKDTINDVFPVVNGVKLQTSPVKSKETTHWKNCVTLPSQVNSMSNKYNLLNYRNPRNLPDAIVNNLEQKAFNSICSVLGNSDVRTIEGIVANGKEILSKEREGIRYDHDSSPGSHFSMWKNNTEHDFSAIKTGRQCKSADVRTKKKIAYIYRPSSSLCSPIYSERRREPGPFMNPDLCVTSRQSSNSPQKVSPSINDQQTLKYSIDSNKSKPTKTRKVIATEVPNYGTSSSSTPDIYDEYASKRKPKASRRFSSEQNSGHYTIIRHKPCGKYVEDAKKYWSKKHNQNTGDDVASTKSKSYDGMKTAKYQNNNYETGHSTWTQSHHNIPDANMSEQSDLINTTELEAINETTQTGLATCSMCRHESKLNAETEICDLNETVETEQHAFPTSTSSVCVTKGIEESKINFDNTLTVTNQRVALLDKMNLFVDGMCSPRESESLEDLENIKNIIKINPMDTSYIKNSLTSSDKDTLNMCMRVQADYLTSKPNSKEKRNLKRDSQTYNQCFLRRLDTHAYLNSFQNWKPRDQQPVKTEPGSIQLLPYTKSSSTGNNHQKKEYHGHFEQPNETEETQPKDLSVEMCHEYVKHLQDDNSKSSTDCSLDNDPKSIDSSDSEQDYRNLVIDTFARDRLESMNYSDKSVHKKSDNSELEDDGSLPNLHREETSFHNNNKEPREISDVKTKTAKDFGEFIKKKRTTHPKKETEIEKKHYWKSACPKPAQQNRANDIIEGYNKRKSSKQKKCANKSVNELKTSVQISDCHTTTENDKNTHKTNQMKLMSIKGDKVEEISTKTDCQKKRNKTTVSNETRLSNQPCVNVSFEKTTDKSNKHDNCGSIKENKKQLKTKSRRPKTVESKSVNKRILRPRAAKSARPRRRSLKNTDIPDIYSNTVEADTAKKIVSPKKSLDCPKSIARQKKLRRNIHDSFLIRCNEGDNSTLDSKLKDTEMSNDGFFQQESDNIEVDESSILCETIPYEHILETNIETLYQNDVDLLTNTFITQSYTEELHDQNLLENGTYYVTDGSVENTEVHNPIMQNIIDSSHNANIEIKSEHIKEDLLMEKTHSDHEMNDIIVDSATQQWLYQDENGEMKEIDLSELPQSVLEIVLSDHLMEFPTEGVVVEDKQVPTSEIELCCNIGNPNPPPRSEVSHTNMQTSPNPYRTSLEHLQEDVTNSECDKIDDSFQSQINSTHDNADSENCVGEPELDRVSQLSNNTFGNDSIEKDVSDKCITVMHPNGSKVVLSESHPAFALFSDIFIEQNDMIEANDSEATVNLLDSFIPDLVTDIDEFIRPPLLSRECGSQKKVQENAMSLIEETEDTNGIHSNDTNDKDFMSIPAKSIDESNIKKANDMAKDQTSPGRMKSKLSNDNVITKERGNLSIHSADTSSVAYNTKAKAPIHRENIFDLLSAELNAVSQHRTSNAQLDLFPETIIDTISDMEIKNKYVDVESELKSKCTDFENEFIKMIKDNFDSNPCNQADSQSLTKKNRPNRNCHSTLTKGSVQCNKDKSNRVESMVPTTDADSQFDEDNLVNSNTDDIMPLNISKEKINSTEQTEPYDGTHNCLSKKASHYSMGKSEELSSLNEETPVYRSAALGLRVAKSNVNPDTLNQVISESELSRTCEYGARSNTLTDLTDSEFQISDNDDDDVADCDYFPEDEGSESNLPAGYTENVNDLFAKLKHQGSKYEMQDKPQGKTLKILLTKVHPNKKHISYTDSDSDLTSETWTISTASCQSGETDVYSSESNSQHSKSRKPVSSSKTRKKTAKERKGKSKTHKKHKTEVQTISQDLDDQFNERNDDIHAANNLVKTQKLYFDILKSSTGSGESHNVNPESCIDIENMISTGFPVKRDRDISRAEAEADRLKEGTGSLDDLEREDDSDTIAEDPRTHCRYQTVEDEDGISLGGVVYYNEYTLPFVYINGYKYTPLKDAVTLFQPDCCAWKCRIPRSVLTKNKNLIKTFSTWDQVYKLELIKLKKGPPITTGDNLVKLDSLVNLLPSLLLEIIAEHKDSKLKHSQDCDMNSYSTLQNKLM